MTDWQRSAEFEEWPGCAECRHLDLENLSCAAYPDEIPLPIMSGEVDHMVDRPGQVDGTRFESKHAIVRAPERAQRRSLTRLR